MICIFCNKETGTDKRWHLDCFDTAIEEEFGVDMYNLLLERSILIQKGKVPYWIEKLVEEGVEEGRRHKTRFKIYLSLYFLKVPKEKIRELIWKFNENCRPPEKKNIVEYHINYLERRFFG